MKAGYSFKEYDKENMARAIGKSLPISFKQSIEICNSLRSKKISRAKSILNEVISEKVPMPFTRFTGDVGHRRGNLAAGRFPIKASKEILDLLNLVEANAQFKGLNTSSLIILRIVPNKGPTTARYGRKRSRSAKRTSIEVVVQEKVGDKKQNKKGVKEPVKKESNVVKKETPKKQDEKPKASVKETKPIEKQEIKTKPVEKTEKKEDKK